MRMQCEIAMISQRRYIYDKPNEITEDP